MLKKRLIPLLPIMNGHVVRCEGFRLRHPAGDLRTHVARYNDWQADELVCLDITPGGDPQALTALATAAKSAFMPLTFGGGVRSVEDMRTRLRFGADKVVLNSAAVRDPGLVTAAAHEFGSQAVVVAVDVRRAADGAPEVTIDCGRTATGLHPTDWIKRLETLGAGEILLQSVDLDGCGAGYDLALAREAAASVRLPILLAGGAGTAEHVRDALEIVSGAVVGNMLMFKELSYPRCKQALARAGVVIRETPP
jgi:imidazole glycerol-phosphate synthase subunit HisF